MTRPSFIIAGAPRSATTYLYDLLDSHPDVFMAKPKRPEPKFFLIDEEFQKGLNYYCTRYFTGAEGFAAVGEKSTNYLENNQVAVRIKHLLPDVRLIFVLRNPVDRAYSNYRWSLQNGLESLSFAEAIAQEEVRERAYPEPLIYARPFSYVSRGRYADLLKPYFDLFESSRIKVLLLDDILAAPDTEANRLFSFLQIPAVPLSFNLKERVNAATAATPELPAAVAMELHEVFRGPNEKLAALLRRDLSCWEVPANTT